VTQVPIACELSTPEFAARKAGLLASVRRRATAFDQLPDGVRLTLADTADAVAEVLELIRLESACCRFLRFDLELGPAGTPVTLTLSGPPGTCEFLATLGWGDPAGAER
jgi:hypothetical protein